MSYRSLAPPTWQALAVVGERRILNASFLILLMVPVVARLLHSADGLLQDLAGTVARELAERGLAGQWTPNPGLLPHLELPLNLVRAFWASAAIAVAQMLFGIACPPILRERSSYEKWLETDPDAYEQSHRLTSDLGETAEHDIRAQLRETFASKRRNACIERPLARALTTLLYSVAAYLTLRIIIDQLRDVLGSYTVARIFF